MRISRKKITAILILAAVLGILVGLMIAGGLRKMIRVRRNHRQITQSTSSAVAAAAEGAEEG